MKTINSKKTWLRLTAFVIALLAFTVTTLTNTSCSSDDNDDIAVVPTTPTDEEENITYARLWKAEAGNGLYDGYCETYIDFSKPGVITTAIKPGKEMAHKYGLDEGKVYAMEATSYDYSFVPDGEKATTGKLLLAGKELARYTLTAKTLTLKVEDTETKYTASDETVITGFESKLKEIDVDDIIQTEVVTLEKQWISDRFKNLLYEFRKDGIIMAVRQDNGKYARQTRSVKYNDDITKSEGSFVLDEMEIKWKMTATTLELTMEDKNGVQVETFTASDKRLDIYD